MPFLLPKASNKSHAASNPPPDSVFNPVFSLEFLYATSRVHKLLFAGKERVALGTDFNVNILHRGTRLDDVAAGTIDRRFFILRMDTLFHDLPP